MGHQFGASHTQNNDCNRYDPTAVEPEVVAPLWAMQHLCAKRASEF